MKNFLRNLIAPVVVALLVSGIAQSGFQLWSTTPASNATADATINWSEGMSPSSVNDSARAMMARLAEFRKDNGGIVVTTGTSTAYSLATNQGDFTADAAGNGFTVGFIPNVTNAVGPVTINVDGTSAKPLRQQTVTALKAGVLVAGSVYKASYRQSTDEWLLHANYPSQFEVPVGSLLPYTGTAAPNSNYVIPIGQAISRTTYSVYFALVGTTYGVGDGTTTFNVPDMRGRIAAGDDALGGSLAGRLNTDSGMTAATIGATGGAQTHTLTRQELSVNLGTATSVVTDAGHTHKPKGHSGSATTNSPAGNYSAGTVGTDPAFRTTNTDDMATTTSSTTGITVATTITNAAGGNAHSIIQPTIMTYWILRVN